MSFKRRVLPLALAVCMLLVSASAPAFATQIPIYWGANLSDTDPATLDGFETSIGAKESLVVWTQPWSREGVTQDFPVATMQAARDRGSIPFLTWQSWDDTGDASQPDFQLNAIASGNWDSYITDWARASAAWGAPYFLRLDPEMNGFSQYPWAEQLNGNQPGDYVRAWRHVRDIFEHEGAHNASLVWCPSTSGPQSVPLGQLYAGDEYVDWVCMDGYNFGDQAGYEWQSFAQIFAGGASFGAHNTYQELLQLAPNKPMMIGATGTATTGGDAATWINEMLNTQLPEHFPQVKGLIWGHPNSDVGSLDQLIEHEPGVRDAFTKALSTGYYAGNQFTMLDSTPINPLVLPPGPGTVELVCIQDTYISASNPDFTGAGSALTLRSDVVGTDTAFMRFDMTSLLGHTITNVVLQVHTAADATAGSTAQHTVKLVVNNGWKEAYMSYNNTPSVSNVELGYFVAPTPSTLYEIPLAARPFNLYQGRQVSVAIDAQTSGLLLLSSRESGDTTAPRLIVTYG